MNFRILSLILGFLSLAAASCTASPKTPQPVILISIDGFRADYLDRYPAPTLTTLAAEGVRARWMTPVFPTLTFPNHYSIATGLYPGRHGIVGNNIYSPEFMETFALSKREEVGNGRWWLGEPIWVTAEKQGQRAGAFFFPGTEAEIAGIRPTFWRVYDGGIPNFERVDTVLSWFDLPEPERPTMITKYFSDVDSAGHDSGPDSESVRAAVAEVDRALARLVEGLKSRALLDRVNLIVVSDHGMAPQDPRQTILLDEYFDVNQAEAVVWNGAMVHIFPKPGMDDDIYSALAEKAPPQLHVHRKEELPARLHYGESDRIGAVVVIADEGWRMASREGYRAPEAIPDGGVAIRGAHGLDNRLESMRALFVARGPAFRKGVVVEPFESVDVYNIMTRILALKPAPNDGGEAAADAVLLEGL